MLIAAGRITSLRPSLRKAAASVNISRHTRMQTESHRPGCLPSIGAVWRKRLNAVPWLERLNQLPRANTDGRVPDRAPKHPKPKIQQLPQGSDLDESSFPWKPKSTLKPRLTSVRG